MSRLIAYTVLDNLTNRVMDNIEFIPDSWGVIDIDKRIKELVKDDSGRKSIQHLVVANVTHTHTLARPDVHYYKGRYFKAQDG
jgi:hypothetical protein